MIDAGQIMAYLDLDSGKFKSGMKSALSAIKDLGNSSLPTSAKLKGLGGAMGQVGRDASALTLAIAAVGTASVAAYAQLDTAARKVSTVADGAIVSLQGIKDGTRELSNELRTMPTDVAAGLYDMISANGDTANAFDYTAIAVKAAKGGFTDTATAVDGLTTVMNAYAMTGVDAMQRVSDQMLIAQNYGKTTFGRHRRVDRQRDPTDRAAEDRNRRVVRQPGYADQAGHRNVRSGDGPEGCVRRNPEAHRRRDQGCQGAGA